MREFGFALYMMLELRDEETEPERLTFTVPTPPKPMPPPTEKTRVSQQTADLPEVVKLTSGPTKRDPTPEEIAAACAAIRRGR